MTRNEKKKGQGTKKIQNAISRVSRGFSLDTPSKIYTERLQPFSGRDSFRKAKSVEILPESSPNLYTYKTQDNRARPEHIRFIQDASCAETEFVDESEDDSNVSDTQRSLTPPTKLHRKHTHSNQNFAKGKRKTNNTTAEHFSSDDELANDTGITSSKRTPQKPSAKLVKTIVAAKNALDSIGDPQEVEGFLAKCTTKDSAAMQSLLQKCAVLAQSIHTSSNDIDYEIPSTAPLYNETHVYRTSSTLLSVVQPVDVFKTFSPYSRKKVSGFVRQDGLPMMYSLPGTINCVESHPKMLDSEVWTNEVKFWAKAHNLKFQTYVWDVRHGKKTFFASHVELRLMLWFATDLMFKITGTKQPSLRQQIGETFRLRTLTQGVNAEIVLSKAPCSSCLKFATKFQDYTGLKFIFTVIGNVGPLRVSRNEKGVPNLDKYASMSDSDDSESEFERSRREAAKPVQRGNSQLQVLVREKQATEVRGLSRTLDVMVKVDDRMLQSRSLSKGSKRGCRQPHVDEDNESEFELPASRSKSKRDIPTTPTRSASGRNRVQPVSTFDNAVDDPFGQEARAFAEQFKNGKGKKRKPEDSYPSPMSAKKTGRHHYFDLEE